MARTSHTHKGHCQICGRLQAVHNATGKLADHGYTLPEHWGFRSGSCHGALALPFEKSRDLIPGFIRLLENAAAENAKQAATIRAEGTERDLPTNTGMGETIARLADGAIVFRTWTRPNAWAKKAGAKPTIAGERGAAERFENYMSFPTAAEKVAHAETLFAEACERLAKQFDGRSEQCRRDATQWQARFDSWVAGAPLVEVKAK